MAEAAVSKPNIFSPKCLGNTTYQYHHHQRLSLVPNQSCATTFQSLKLLRSTAADFHGSRLVFGRGQIPTPTQRIPQPSISNAQMSIGLGKAQRWWEKALQPNMKEVMGAQDLVDSLLNAGDKLVVVDFFSPGCGGCKALHPKICQLAEMNPDVLFLQVNYEEHKSMCYSLNVHVLPFFRFYRGAHGRLCSFSCTNATIKKFKDALAKYGADFCSLEPTKGLVEKELLALAANRDLSFNYTPKPERPVIAPEQEETLTEVVVSSPHANSECSLPLPLPLPSTTVLNTEQDPVKRTLIPSGR